MKICTCASPDSPVEALRPSPHNCDEPNKEFLAPTRLVRKPSKLQTTVEVTRCRFGNTSRQAAPMGSEDCVPQKDWTPVFHAVYHDREAALHHFLQTGVSPDATDGTGVPLLCIAAACGHFEIAKILLDAGALVDAVSRDKGESALHVAIKGSRHDIIDLLLVHRIDPETRTIHTGETALHYAAAGPGSLALVMKLLKFGAKYDVQNLEGQTPAAVALQAHNLHAAVAIINMARGKPKQLAKEKDMLLQHVERAKERSSMTNDLIADVFTATCDPDSTVLVEAVKKNDARLVEMFLEKGADPHRATAKGLLPIFVAVEFAGLPTIKLLVQHGADITVACPEGLNLVQVLLMTSSKREEGSIVAIVDYLLTKGVDGLALYPEGKTLLHQMVSTSTEHAKMVKLLLKNGVEINARDNNGNTALHLAASNGLEHTTKVLLDARADITVVDSNRRTPLLCAVHHQQWSIVPLLAVPPTITSWDAEGSTALHHVARSIPKDHATWMDVAAAAKALCESGVCRSMRDRSGATPLIQAVRVLPEEGLPVIETLLTGGGKDRNCVGHEDHKGHNALYYAATLGKPVFVEVLLKYGAPLDLKDWADGTRQFKLPAASKGRILELIVENDRTRQAQEVRKLHSPVQEPRIEIIKPEPRTSSALSGYRADCETERKPKPNRNNVKKVPSMQHLQVPDHRQKRAAPSPAFPTRSSSKQLRSREATAQQFQAVRHPHITVSPSSISKGASQTVLANIQPGSLPHRAYQPIKATGKAPSSQGLRDAASAFPSRASSKQQMTTLPIESTSRKVPIAPILEKKSIPVVIPPNKNSPATAKLEVPIKEVRVPQQAPKAPVEPTPTATPVAVLNRSKPATPPKPFVIAYTASSEKAVLAAVEHVKPTPPPKPSSAGSTLSATAKPVQPARVDSGVSLTQNDSAKKALPVLNRSTSTLDGSAPNAKRQSGDELAGWLAISNMLDRL